MAVLGRLPGLGGDTARVSRRFDFAFLASALILMLIGFMALYSQGHDRPETQFPKQVFNAVVGLVPFALFLVVPPRFWQRAMPLIYGLNVVMLIAVLRFGHKLLEATRWIQVGPLQFQPSEISKLLIVLTLAAFFASRQDRIDRLSTFALSFLHVAVPMLLILKQPHLGATLVVFMIWLVMSIASNVPTKFIVGALAMFAMMAVVVFSVPWLRGLLFHDYQLGRIEGVQGSDVKGGKWQTHQAEIAFGVGGVNGSGYLGGAQKKLGVIPEQDNDFIFSVIGEEGGLIGSSLVLAAFGFFFYRIWLIMLQATEPYYRGIAAGILGLLAFHMIVNVSMVLGIIPVVGLWLPFISAGGSALWLCMACVGLLLNVRSKERPVLFS